MTQVNKNDVNQIFASNAPDQDKPPSFQNYTTGWGTSRSNNGKPTIKGFNFLQQRTDQNFLWIHQNGGALPYDASIEYVDGSIVLKDGKLQQVKNGVWSSYGSSDSDITTWTGNSQADENKKFVTTVDSYIDLSSLKAVDGRVAIVKGDGTYYYSGTQKAWIKDEPFAVYDFKTEQPIQAYYDLLGNWDDAIYQAQKNIYLLGYSNTLRFPVGNIEITRPIYGGQGLIEYMEKNNPEIDTSGQWIPLTIIGSPRSTEGRPENTLGTQIVFNGIKSPTDLTWSNYGIIHSAPLDYKKMESDDIKNPASVILRDINIRPANINLGGSSIHGIVIRNGSKHYFQNVTVYGCYGAGFYGSWIFDSQFDQLTVIRCGRMSPDSTKFMADGNLDVQYQTYAPIHITQPDTHVGDNSNFLYFHKLHLEDNTYANGDIIINGDSSPIIFYDSHHETDGNGVGSKALKTCVLLGGYGVKYFGQDQESGFDYTNFAKTNRAGYATLVNATVYSSDYAYASKQTQYCAISYHSANLGGLPIYVYSYNSGGSVTLDNTSIGELIHEGFTDRGNLLTASQSTIGNIYLGRGNGSGGSISLVNCDCGSMSIGSNSTGSWASGLEIRATNTSFSSITGSYPNFYGDIKLTSTTSPSTFNVLYKADIDIRSYNFLETTGA